MASYSIFLLVVVLAFLALSKSVVAEGNEQRWERFASSFSHGRVLALLGIMMLPKLFIVRSLISASGQTSSLYEATRTVRGALSGELLMYQYLNIATAYPAAAAFALWLGIGCRTPHLWQCPPGALLDGLRRPVGRR